MDTLKPNVRLAINKKNTYECKTTTLDRDISKVIAITIGIRKILFHPDEACREALPQSRECTKDKMQLYKSCNLMLTLIVFILFSSTLVQHHSLVQDRSYFK